MRILLDENLDWRLRHHLPGYEVESVPLLGWAGIKNGDLLTQAQKQFDLLITMVTTFRGNKISLSTASP